MQERLSTCTLVCQTWAAAGAGASKVLAVQLRSQAQADNLTAWLAQHGSAIEQLSVATDHQVSTGLAKHALLSVAHYRWWAVLLGIRPLGSDLCC